MKAALSLIPRLSAGLALVALCACHPPQLEDSAPVEASLDAPAYNPPAPTYEPTETPLLGAPPGERPPPRRYEPPPPTYQAVPEPPRYEPPPPRYEDAPPVVAMAPIPDEPIPAPRPRREPRPIPAPIPTPRPAPAPKPAPKPAPAPKAAPAPTPQPVTKPAPKPIPSPARKPAPAPAPAPKAAPAPTPKPAPPRPTAKSTGELPVPDSSERGPPIAPLAKSGTPAARLGKILGDEISANAKLEIPDGLPNGRTGVIVLVLPENFASRLREEAARLGLSEAAAKADLRATLTGEGYNINPTGAQMVEVGNEPIRFSWLVSEGTDSRIEKTPLRAEIIGELKGDRRAQSFPLAAIGGVPAAFADQPKPPGKAPALPAGMLALAAPLVLILIALFILGRWAKSRQDERQRRRAALEEFHS